MSRKAILTNFLRSRKVDELKSHFWYYFLSKLCIFQNNERKSSEFEFGDAGDAGIEGSGFDGELNRDLESSGSGQGPPGDDDEDIDTINKSDIKPDSKLLQFF